LNIVGDGHSLFAGLPALISVRMFSLKAFFRLALDERHDQTAA
jgi:hypothetical protein